jgi:hypothetical protein
MVCGEPPALSTIFMDATNAPVVVGPKWPWMVQFAPAARVGPQLFVNTNDDAFVPVTPMLVIESVESPVLVRVTVCDPLIAPTFTVPNDSVVADSFSNGTATPVPLSAIDCGDPVALSVMVMAAVSAPEANGPKCPWTVQFAPAARLVPQALAKTNDEALVPVTATLAMESAALPVLVKVTDAEPLVDPTFTLPNNWLVVDSFTTGTATPVPLSAMDCGDPAALSVIVIAAVSAPAASGPK